MPQTIDQALSAASLYTDGRSYSFVRLPITELAAAASHSARFSLTKTKYRS